jgi:ParB family chromosome partitioning protein
MGERRLRASKLAGLKTIPVIIRQTPDNELLREALLENIHRSQLNPLEEGSAYQNLLNDFGYTHEELASKVGKSRSTITNTLRLLNLPPAVQRRVAAGVLSAGHARALLTLNDESEIEKLANRINAEGLSVRATEEIVATAQNTTSGNNSNKPSSGKGTNSSALTARLKEVADEIGSTLDTRVTVELGKQKGKITIEFATLEDLDRIAGLI